MGATKSRAARAGVRADRASLSCVFAAADLE